MRKYRAIKYRELSDMKKVGRFPSFRNEVKIDGTNFENRDTIEPSLIGNGSGGAYGED
jgi:hypothetical protein